MEQFKRTTLLIGNEGLQKLKEAKVAVIGLGGVGSYAVEALVRAGIGSFLIIDFDRISESNINRQLIALHSTVGKLKTDIIKERMLDINPYVQVEVLNEFFAKENRLEHLGKVDYILDAIDSIGPKMGMIKDLLEIDLPFISVLGAGNRLDPTKIEINSIWESKHCPLAKRLKKLLRRYGVTKDFPVVFSSEKPIGIEVDEPIILNEIRPDSIPKTTVGSISYMPAIMGMMAASWVIRSIIE
ncbi:MAG TPA: tRNA threonylcarbamoyladenosine dehydratase [Candidatus Cloacimonadota bacterium]|nr:tRNA threonylcarbamoyladenosine dehydratase [Candidatus Cloacimonadota bacterium]